MYWFKSTHSTNFSFILCLLFSMPVMAEDSFVTKAREDQQEMLDSLTVLNNKINFGEKKQAGKQAAFKMSAVSLYTDSSAFPDGVRDPFAVPSLLLQSLVNERHKKEARSSMAGHAFARDAALIMPKIKLKGVLHQRGSDSPLAIVLLNNETYMVREGDEVGFNAIKPSHVIKIKEIKRLSVLVEVGTLGELVVVR